MAAYATVSGSLAGETVRKRFVTIMGPTGSGKSQLAIDIALALGKEVAEIVNSDVIQMYRGLDIASAKVTPAEMHGIPHHLMSFLLPRAQFTVRDFRSMATGCIEDIISRGKVPIVVGGTMYYTQSLMREGGTLEDVEEETSSSSSSSSASSASSSSASSSEYTYARLREVDPVMARRLHPDDTRKITRALEAFDRTGTPYSELLLKQQQQQKEKKDGDGAPIKDGCFVIWTTVENKAVHDTRLDGRVDKMMEKGLTTEMRGLKQYLEATEPLMAKATAEGVDSPLLQSLLTVSLDGEDDDDHSASADVAAARAASEEHLASEHRGPTELTMRLLKGQRPLMRLASGISEKSSGAAEDKDADNDNGSSYKGSYQGLLQAIGYKEFAAYLQLRDDSSSSSSGSEPPAAKRGKWEPSSSSSSASAPSSLKSGKGKRGDSTDDDAVSTALAEGVRRLKEATHQYARVQQRFIRNRFAKRGVPMLVLDTSDAGASAEAWRAKVVEPAMTAIQAWLRGETNALPAPSTRSEDKDIRAAADPSSLTDVERVFTWRKFACAACSNERRWNLGLPPLPAPPPLTSSPAAGAGSSSSAEATDAVTESAAQAFTAWEGQEGLVALNGSREWDDHLRSRQHRASIHQAALRDKLLKERGIVLQPKKQAAKAASKDSDTTAAEGERK